MRHKSLHVVKFHFYDILGTEIRQWLPVAGGRHEGKRAQENFFRVLGMFYKMIMMVVTPLYIQ